MLLAQVAAIPTGINKELLLQKWGDELRFRTAALINASVLVTQASGKEALSQKCPLTHPQVAN